MKNAVKLCQLMASSDSYWLEVKCNNMDLLVDCCRLHPSSADPTKGVENYPSKFKWLLIHCHGYHRFHIICALFNSDGLGSSAKDKIRGGGGGNSRIQQTHAITPEIRWTVCRIVAMYSISFINCIWLNIYWLQQMKHCWKEHKHNC